MLYHNPEKAWHEGLQLTASVQNLKVLLLLGCISNLVTIVLHTGIDFETFES